MPARRAASSDDKRHQATSSDIENVQETHVTTDQATAPEAQAYFRIHPEVAAALEAGEPVVALESTIISHGLPRPDNLRVAKEIEDAVRKAGAVPATIAVIAGTVCVGLSDEELSEIATRDDVVKLSERDLAPALALGRYGATTVAATAHIAFWANIKVFATGGLGGVHRGARETWDESADLNGLAHTPIAIVCSGVKSILDVPATLERLETLNIPVLGYRTSQFPGFYLADSGHSLTWRLDTPAEVADVIRAQAAIATTDQDPGMIVANPLPVESQLDPALHDRVLGEALTALASEGVTGKDVTPFLLEYFHKETHGESLRANVALVLRNAELAAQIAVELAQD
jgi:pseudouridylate synthase